MGVKYVKDFAYDSGFGFTGSSGKNPVKAHMRKAPALAPAMVEKTSPKMGGKASETKNLAAYNKPHMEGKKGPSAQPYAKGGKVQKYSNGNVVRMGATRAAAMTPQASRAAAAASQAAGTNAYNRMLNNAYSQYMQNANLLSKAAAPSALRVAGKIASRAIPYAGTALLAKDAYDVAKDLYDQYQQSQQSGPTYNPEMEQPGLAKGGKVKKHKAPKEHRYAGGGKVRGSFRRDADGIASKGKTKGKIVKMRYGGEC